MASFNTEEPGVMWIDLNSAFATTEQQSRPSLRGKPVGVTNRISKECCVIAASYEAKRRGVKVGCRRSEAVAICPDLVMLETDPPKYHHVYEKLFAIMQDYTPKAKMKSIDEGVLDFHHLPEAGREAKLVQIGHEIKARVRAEIGDYMMINVGIGTNRFLAKMAASLHKPDGLDVLTHKNIHEIFATLELEDLTGIAQAFGRRLRSYGIQTPTDFLAAREDWLQKVVFRSICGSYWYQRLRGFEVDDYQTKLELHELRQTLTGQSAAIEVIQRQLSDLTKMLSGAAEPLPVADVTNLPLSELKLPKKTYNSLWKAGLSTIQDLFELRSIHDLRAIRNLGKIGQAAVIRRMYETGFTSWADRMSKRPYRRADKV